MQTAYATINCTEKSMCEVEVDCTWQYQRKRKSNKKSTVKLIWEVFFHTMYYPVSEGREHMACIWSVYESYIFVLIVGLRKQGANAEKSHKGFLDILLYTTETRSCVFSVNIWNIYIIFSFRVSLLVCVCVAIRTHVSSFLYIIDNVLLQVSNFCYKRENSRFGENIFLTERFVLFLFKYFIF